MVLLLCYALCLLAAALISERANRTVLSTAALFLVVGTLLGDGLLGVIEVQPDGELVANLAEIALVAVLFTDGMQLGFGDLRAAWRQPGRALFFGLPLTLAGTAVLAAWIVGLGWEAALLVGAALSPTDPVLANAIVGRPEVPRQLRHLLNVESGFNDGLALPFLVILMQLGQDEPPHWLRIGGELAAGVGIGIGIAYVAIRLVRLPVFGLARQYSGLGLVAVGLLTYAVTSLAHANAYLGAFTAGMTVATVGPDEHHDFEILGERITELLKLAALLVFGALISPDVLGGFDWRGYLFAALTLFLVRPIALLIALVGEHMDPRQFAAAAWFGPKGFASVVYALLILNAGVRGGPEIFHLVALVVAGSVVLHSSTDVAVSGWLAEFADGDAEPMTAPETEPDAEAQGE